MFDVLFMYLVTNFDVAEVDEGAFALNGEEDDVHGAFKGSRRIAKYKRRSGQLV